MKTHLIPLAFPLAVLLGFAAGPARALPEVQSIPCILYPVSHVKTHMDGSKVLKAGALTRDVEFAIGIPHHRPSHNVWIYHRFFADREEANRQGCSNLVIVFAHGRVSALKLVNDHACARIIAQAEAVPEMIPRMLVARK